MNDFLWGIKLDPRLLKHGISTWHSNPDLGFSLRFGSHSTLVNRDNPDFPHKQKPFAIELTQSSQGNHPVDFSQCQVQILKNGEVLESQNLRENPCKASLIAALTTDITENPNCKLKLIYAGFGADENDREPCKSLGGPGPIELRRLHQAQKRPVILKL
ncbi:MAG: hypothetical protein OXU45_08385 [Candidatus Melainabacteria bacterium]|nr:hypothetical protein [Candidatus Melainabacteria bacterium]